MTIARGLVVAACALISFACATPGVSADTPNATPAALAPFDPAKIATTIDNPYFPLVPGTIFTYDGLSDGETEHEEVTVLHETKTILGVSCIVVLDIVWIAGEKVEETRDWYAQDRDGNVWYMGEAARSFDNGKTSTAGSWEAGVDGALPGIIMPAHPVVGQPYQQEYYPGEAEDMAQATALDATVTIGLGAYDHVLVTEEWSPLEPGIREQKSYAPGIGLIHVIAISGEAAVLELTAITEPGSPPTASPTA